MRFKALVTTWIIENGRLLHGLALFPPFVKNEVILAFFHRSGKGPVDTDWLKFRLRVSAIRTGYFLSSLTEIESSRAALN